MTLEYTSRRIIRTNGTEQGLTSPHTIKELETMFGVDRLDVVALRHGMVMLVTDMTHQQEQPINHAATSLYHGMCRPGIEWKIHGDVFIVPDSDFGAAYG